MATRLFVNLPVQDLNRSMEFFRALGCSFDPRYSDQTAACMILSEDAYVMLLTRDKFREFSPHSIADTRESTEVLLALSRDSREEVDETIRRALDAGGTSFREGMDLGSMYGQSFQDPDGHVWEIFFMDPGSDSEPGAV